MCKVRGAILFAALVLVACAPLTIGEGPTAVAALPADAGPVVPSQVIALPEPRLKGSLSLEEALSRRRSVRDFGETPLTPAELGQLLWAAQGITSPDGRRTAPSAGALYPLEVYAVLPDAVYHFEPQGYRLSVHTAGDRRDELYSAALRQVPVLKAPAVIVIAAVYERTARKYGEERTSRYVHLEAGHAAQNILLQAVAMDLGAVPVGAFSDDQIQQALALPLDQEPLYLIPVGHPKR
jgi:SagB-type dehydrogenase family enzyme